MGTTIDLTQSLLGRAVKPSAKGNSFEATPAYRSWKYIFLAAILAGGVGGVSLVHLGSPLSLITRVYGIVSLSHHSVAGGTGISEAVAVRCRTHLPGINISGVSSENLLYECLRSVRFCCDCGVGLCATTLLVQKSLPCRSFDRAVFSTPGPEENSRRVLFKVRPLHSRMSHCSHQRECYSDCAF